MNDWTSCTTTSWTGSRRDSRESQRGIVVTGDSDGSQHIIGNLCNFFNGVGLIIPPYATLTVLWDKHAKSAKPTREELLRKYEKDYAKTAEKMIEQLVAFAGR